MRDVPVSSIHHVQWRTVVYSTVHHCTGQYIMADYRRPPSFLLPSPPWAIYCIFLYYFTLYWLVYYYISIIVCMTSCKKTMADWAGDVTGRHDSCLLRLICGEESLWSRGSRGTRTLHSTNIFYFQIFSAGGELKYFLCCLAIYLTSICEYIKLLHLTWWMPWLKSSGFEGAKI